MTLEDRGEGSECLDGSVEDAAGSQAASNTLRGSSHGGTRPSGPLPWAAEWNALWGHQGSHAVGKEPVNGGVWKEGVSTAEQSATSRSRTWAGDSRCLPACPGAGGGVELLSEPSPGCARLGVPGVWGCQEERTHQACCSGAGPLPSLLYSNIPKGHWLPALTAKVLVGVRAPLGTFSHWPWRKRRFAGFHTGH